MSDSEQPPATLKIENNESNYGLQGSFNGPATLKIENNESNYGLQGNFNGPVSISQYQPSVVRESFCSIASIEHRFLNLGIKEEATFPYISEFIQDVYDETVEFLHKASESGDNLLILGLANAGKTRLVVEALKSALSHWTILLWTSRHRLADLPPEQVLKKRSIVIFIDDLQNFVPPKSFKNQALSEAYPPAEDLPKMIRIVEKNAWKVILVAACRSEDEKRTNEEFPELLKNFTTISIRPFPSSKHDSLVIQIIKRFGEKGASSLEDWDRTLGSLILSLTKQHDLYMQLKSQPQADPVRILWAMKLLTIANITDYTEKRVRAVCADVFKEGNLQSDNSIWEVALSELKRIRFVDPFVTKDSEGNTETRLIIRKDLYFERVITGYPDTSDIQSHLRLLKMTLTKLQDAFGLLNLGVTYTDKQEYMQAKETLQAALMFDQEMPLGWINLGIAHFHLQEIQQSLEAFDQSVYLDDTSARAWYNKGFLHLVKEEYEDSLNASQIALSCDPSWTIAYLNKSLALSSLGRYDEALTEVDCVLEADPHSAQALATKATIFENRGENDEALRLLNMALSEDRIFIAALIDKGQILFNVGRFQEALIVYKKVLEYEPLNVDAMWGKACTLQELARFQEALDAYDDILPSKKMEADVWNNKSFIFNELGQHNIALECINRAIELSPSDGEIWHSKGEIYYDQKKYKEALKAFDKSIYLDNRNDKFLLCRAKTLYLLKRYKRALLDLNKIQDTEYHMDILVLRKKILSYLK